MKTISTLLFAAAVMAAGVSAAWSAEQPAAEGGHILIWKTEGEPPVVSCRLARQWSLEELSVLIDEPFRIEQSSPYCADPVDTPLFGLKPLDEPAPGVKAPEPIPDITRYCACTEAWEADLQERFAPIYRRRQVAEEITAKAAIDTEPRKDDLFFFRQINPGANIIGTDEKADD